jgi:hypothetical protein
MKSLEEIKTLIQEIPIDKGGRRQFNHEFRTEVVTYIQNSNSSIPKIANELGICSVNLYAWWKHSGIHKKKVAKKIIAKKVKEPKATLSAQISITGGNFSYSDGELYVKGPMAKEFLMKIIETAT